MSQDKPASSTSDPEGWFGGFRDAMREISRHPASDAPVLDRYDVLDLLGEGAAARVYRARDRQLDRIVALKVMREALGASDTARERFQREARTAAFLAHPNIIALHDAGVFDGRPYLVMELVDGRPLNEMLRARENVDLTALVRLLEKVCRGMAVAHESGIVHRDLKPANILVDADGEPKVGDFGLAHVAGAEAALTRTGSVMGTPLYMAPEQVQGWTGSISPRTDVYALGAILYEMITGRPPHTGDSVTEIYGRIVGAETTAPRRLRPDTPADLETICLAALEKEPARRYASARELGEDLKRFLDGDSILARPPGLATKASKWLRRHRLAAVSTVSLLLIVALAAWGVGAWRKARDIGQSVEARAAAEGEAMNRFMTAQRSIDEALNALYSEKADYAALGLRVEQALGLVDEGIRKAPGIL